MNSPNENLDPSQLEPPVLPAPDKGSLLTGFLVGWGMLILSLFVAGAVLVSVVDEIPAMDVNVIRKWIGLLPVAGQAYLIVRYIQRGKPRSALGVATVIGSLLALCLLLASACYGLGPVFSAR